MNALPSELRTPPLPLVAFVGLPELHKEVGSFFNTALRPPLVSVGLAEPNEGLLARLFGVMRPPKPFRTPDGILKADWFVKQRQRRPAAVVAFVPRGDADGDPSSWMRMLAGLRTIRAASAHKGVALLVVVVQQGLPLSELPHDRVAGICSSLELEHRHLILISRQLADPALPPDQRKALQEEQLRPLGLLVAEAAAAHYAASAQRLRQRQLDVSASLGSCPPEVAASIAFKLGVLAEFRQDWLGAVTSYQASAAALQAVPLGRPTVSVQRHAEVAAVAEVAHFKAMMLLLHQQRYGEALQQLRSHLATFGRQPDGLPPAAAASHCAWLVRQYSVAADMIAGSRIDDATLQANRDMAPAHLLLSAAQLAVTRKSLADAAAAQRGGAAPAFDASRVRRGRCLGQLELKDGSSGGSCDLTDAEFCQYLEAEEARLNHSQAALDLLLQAQAALAAKQGAAAAAGATERAGAAAAGPLAGRDGGTAPDRQQARLAWLIGEQYLDLHNLTAARKLLLQAAHVYRRDGWDGLLLQVLLLLRDACQRLKLHKEALLHSLEVACLADSLASDSSGGGCGQQLLGACGAALADRQQVQALAGAALAALLTGGADKKGGIMKAPAANSTPAQQQQQQQQLEAGDGMLSQQQLAAGAAEPGAPLSPRLGRVSPVPGGGTSSDAWAYVVQQLDLAAALQHAGSAAVPRGGLIADVLQQHHQQDSGWGRILDVAGGFVAHRPDPAQLCVCIAVRSHLPVPLPLLGGQVTLADGQGSWSEVLAMGLGPPPMQQKQQQQAAPAAAAVAAGVQALQLSADQDGLQHKQRQQQAAAASAGWPLQLQPGRWQLLHVLLTPRCVGGMSVESITLQLSSAVSVELRVKSAPAGRTVLGRGLLRGGPPPFATQAGVREGSWHAKVQHVGALPQLKIVAPELLLVGEFAPLEVTVSVSAQQPACSLELSVRGAAGDALPGPVTLLAAGPHGKLRALAIEGEALELPPLPAGTSRTQRLWLRGTVPGGVRLVAVLSCPALVAQSAELSLAPPFEHVVRLAGDPGAHTLVAPSSSYSAVNVGGPGGTIEGAEQAAGGSSGGVPLAVGQAVLAQVLVRAPHDAQLLLLGAELELQQGSGLQLMNRLADQLPAQPQPISRGAVHCLLLQLVPTAKSTGGPASIGRLCLRWKRGGKQQQQHQADQQQQQQRPPLPPAAGAASARAAGITDGSSSSSGGADGLAVGAAPPEEVVTPLELPQVTVSDGLLSARIVAPHHATAGIAFVFTLQVHNLTPSHQEVVLAVQEAQGFLLSGDKQCSLALGPRDSDSVSWTLVAHASGQLPLPAVRVSSARLACQLLTQSCSIQVMPF